MAENVDQVNTNDEMHSANTFTVKEERCLEDTFTEDKVCISDTGITTDNAEVQGPIWHGKIKQYDESTCLENIKTEYFEMTEVQNGNVKIEGGIRAADIKIEHNSGVLYCEHCEVYYVDYCIECGMLVHILNRCALNNADSGAQDDIPNDILEIQDCSGQTGIYALRVIPAGVKFGPFTGFNAAECPWEMKGEKFVLDKNESTYLNWMQYINPTTKTSDKNLHVFQCDDNIYYQSTRQIQAGDELLVYFGEEYGSIQNNIFRVNFAITSNDDTKDIFACTFCCLGFSSKSHLAKHKTVCFANAAGEFSIEELMQCPFCKIHLDSKEHYKHHMAFCCERNARKGILPTPSAKQSTTALNEPHLKKLNIKCDSCEFRTNRNFHLEVHIKDKHLKQFDYKCDKCEFGTNRKYDLKRHIKIKHLMEFDYKCDSCNYSTNRKHHLDDHIKTKHLKKFDYKCDSCEFETNSKHHLEYHIRTIHLKEFEFKCNSCDFRTNDKYTLEKHIKTKHLRQFDHKCDKCEFGTNGKSQLGYHIKTKHLKEFDYKCDSCEYRTNRKYILKQHIKNKHLKQFDYKCEICEFETNRKTNLKEHMKIKHLKEFNFKCDSCEYGTNDKRYLERHIKKHLKKFEFNCNSCAFRTNDKQRLEKHIKNKHLNELNFKCDSCEYATNYERFLERHIKIKHLK